MMGGREGVKIYTMVGRNRRVEDEGGKEGRRRDVLELMLREETFSNFRMASRRAYLS